MKQPHSTTWNLAKTAIQDIRNSWGFWSWFTSETLKEKTKAIESLLEQTVTDDQIITAFKSACSKIRKEYGSGPRGEDVSSFITIAENFVSAAEKIKKTMPVRELKEGGGKQAGKPKKIQGEQVLHPSASSIIAKTEQKTTIAKIDTDPLSETPVKPQFLFYKLSCGHCKIDAKAAGQAYKELEKKPVHLHLLARLYDKSHVRLEDLREIKAFKCEPLIYKFKSGAGEIYAYNDSYMLLEKVLKNMLKQKPKEQSIKDLIEQVAAMDIQMIRSEAINITDPESDEEDLEDRGKDEKLKASAPSFTKK